MSLSLQLHAPAATGMHRMVYARAQELLTCTSLLQWCHNMQEDLKSMKNKNGTRAEAFIRVYVPKENSSIAHLMYFQNKTIIATIKEL